MRAAVYDTIVVGSGFGGAMAAHPLVNAGQRVLMIERGGWVGRGPQSWNDSGLTTPSWSMASPYRVQAGGRQYKYGAWNCVGGQSVYYGGASYRFRESDFLHHAGVVGDSRAEWPLRYADLEPHYAQAERLLGVAGDAAGDVTAPYRSTPYPQSPAPLSAAARRMVEAGARLGMSASRIPLAINYAACVGCRTCDGYACAADAKNDVATAMIPSLMQRGMQLMTNTAVVRLTRSGTRITGVECVNRVTMQRFFVEGARVIVAAGALATPHLILASGLAPLNPAGTAVGRYLTRHRNALVLGVFARRPNRSGAFDKQVAFFDEYDRAGCIQSMTPPVGLVRAYLPKLVGVPAAMVLSRSSGLLVIAEDQPQIGNGVSLDWRHTDQFGLPKMRIEHRYSARDEAAAAHLVSRSKQVLREAGSLLTIVRGIETWSHALGTVRMGNDPDTSPLDGAGRFRGLDNLYVSDGSALPRSAGVNPSLTIAANALRIGSLIAGESVRRDRSLWVWQYSPDHNRTHIPR